jgi:hypothetical protein
VHVNRFFVANESVEKVSLLKNVPSAESKIENYFLPSKATPTSGATPKPLTKMETISILYYDSPLDFQLDQKYELG